MSAGADELIKIDEEAKEQMDNALYGGLDANMNQQKMAEVHFEAWMRLLDSRVMFSVDCVMEGKKLRAFWRVIYLYGTVLI